MFTGEILIATISSVITCITTIVCFILKNKFFTPKNSKNFFDVISDNKVKEVNIFIKKSSTSSGGLSNFYKIEGSSNCSLETKNLKLNIIMKDNCEFNKNEINKIKMYLKNIEGVLYA